MIGKLARFIFASMSIVAVTLPTSLFAAEVNLCEVKMSTPATTSGPFAGSWLGNWDNALCSAIVVEQTAPTEAKVTYIYGKYTPWYIQQPGNTEPLTAKIDGNQLTVRLAKATATYVLTDGVLKGTYTSDQGRTYKGDFTKDKQVAGAPK